MSYWTNIKGQFTIGTTGKQTIHDMHDGIINQVFQEVEGTHCFKLTESVHGDDFLSALRAYRSEEMDDRDENFHRTLINHAHLLFRDHNSFAFVNDKGETHKVRIPYLPHPPIGSERGCDFFVSFNNEWFCHDVIVKGALRDYDNDMSPYVEWWFKTVSALTNHDSLFVYDVSLEEPVAKSISFGYNTAARLAVIKEYFAIMFAWHKKCEEFLQMEKELLNSEEYQNADWDEKDNMLFDFTNEHQPDFQLFVINHLKNND